MKQEIAGCIAVHRQARFCVECDVWLGYYVILRDPSWTHVERTSHEWWFLQGFLYRLEQGGWSLLQVKRFSQPTSKVFHSLTCLPAFKCLIGAIYSTQNKIITQWILAIMMMVMTIYTWSPRLPGMKANHGHSGLLILFSMLNRFTLLEIEVFVSVWKAAVMLMQNHGSDVYSIWKNGTWSKHMSNKTWRKQSQNIHEYVKGKCTSSEKNILFHWMERCFGNVAFVSLVLFIGTHFWIFVRKFLLLKS